MTYTRSSSSPSPPMLPPPPPSSLWVFWPPCLLPFYFCFKIKEAPKGVYENVTAGVKSTHSIFTILGGPLETHTRSQIPVLPLTHHLVWGKLLTFFQLRFPPPQTSDNSNHFKGFLQRLNDGVWTGHTINPRKASCSWKFNSVSFFSSSCNHSWQFHGYNFINLFGS